MVAVSGDLLTATPYVINITGSASNVGDVNGDGVINISDVTALIDLILSDGTIDSDMKSRADVNGDGVINISDVTALIDLILSK